MKYIYIILGFLILISCKKSDKTEQIPVIEEVVNAKSDSISDLEKSKDFREFKVLDSKILSKVDIWLSLNDQLSNFSQEKYESLKPLLLEQNIPTIQGFVFDKKLTYEDIVKFYLYRIRKFDRENPLSLNAIISINPRIIEEAKLKDRLLWQQEIIESELKFSLYGLPILLKDNINAEGMATTAGSVVLMNNFAKDAFIVSRLKENGAIILGKTNLSEWAYFFCGDCPSGYSAVGGQTLNPYGRRIFDTGGSSSGSGVAVTANFCVAAIGSETSGSILSPSSQNSIVGLKPTIGLVSRSGIVPISSTLDTAGPMTKNVIDNAILLGAIFGEDQSDSKSIYALWDETMYYNELKNASLKNKRFGVIKRLLEDSLYVNAVSILKGKGAMIIEIEEEKIDLPDFRRLLNLDMRKDLPQYLSKYANASVTVRSVQDVIDFNNKDSLLRAPYGQKLFKGIVSDKGTIDTLNRIKTVLHANGKRYFDDPIKTHNLDAVLSINNYHAGFAAVAEYPAITVPMGYTEEGKPKGLTFIGERLQEKRLLELAYGFEQASKSRKTPSNYD